jgi:hypothetical protein
MRANQCELINASNWSPALTQPSIGDSVSGASRDEQTLAAITLSDRMAGWAAPELMLTAIAPTPERNCSTMLEIALAAS